MRVSRVLGTAALVGSAVVLPAHVAYASCHAFDVSVSPPQVSEGGSVTVRVHRDAAVDPSHVDVDTVDGSAHAGSDYTGLHTTVNFTDDTVQTFPVPITNDVVAEGAETFTVHLSNPGGCASNPNFVVGPDAQVTIKASDQPVIQPSPTPSKTKSPPGSIAPSPTPSASKSASPSASATASASASSPTVETTPPDAATPSETATSPATVAVDASGDNGGLGLGIPLAIGLVGLALGTGGLLYLRRRDHS